MTSTALERVDDRPVSIFPGVTADEILATATDVANKFSDVVRQRRMFKRIGESDHIQIEAWQTIGALTGVAAVEAEGVEELPWPHLDPLGEEPPVAGREPRNRDSADWHTWKLADDDRRQWEHHRAMLRARAMGRAYGFKASFRAVKNGVEVGWGEGRCTRGEASKVAQDDYALASMAQTRGMGRAFSSPLRFVVKLAGYEGTPAEELDGAATGSSAPTASEPAPPALPWGPIADDKGDEAAAEAVRQIRPGIDGDQFVLLLGQHFDGIPQACVIMLRGLAKYVATFDANRPADDAAAAEAAPPAPEDSAYHNPPATEGAAS